MNNPLRFASPLWSRSLVAPSFTHYQNSESRILGFFGNSFAAPFPWQTRRPRLSMLPV
jgi:hypothetical protein